MDNRPPIIDLQKTSDSFIFNRCLAWANFIGKTEDSASMWTFIVNNSLADTGIGPQQLFLELLRRYKDVISEIEVEEMHDPNICLPKYKK